MRAEKHFSPGLIAPCGMNCGICSNYLAYKNDVKNKGVNITYCTSCNVRHKNCAFIKKRCPHGVGSKIDYCYQCATFPCENLIRLDTSYRKKYQMSMRENQNFIKEKGMDKFLESQEKRWKCQKCGGIISCHDGICYSCETSKLKAKVENIYAKVANEK
ncbi:hypothetical protein A2X44_04515 [candidate division CPR3 bacterium GWF2_35_18]|uniref:DUF3795 domain-containing protein n=1 Tax=candidate division CPR3 bacterium GW2011_GWF2_35_18 TaxID=1618350 RepID=A0A0G0BZW0_UNCC3|nr:MAG: hypothetical protein UR67_C0007G0091 [candidate division CPR3 bacterium GW2011_GWF2_35_18]OGB62615.1 MAG: hypothetical protein A2X44_04515 [candidate division CPR3 bacterium GWF2_35_18]OGB65866.1 MAG: hypothetical protein A2250_01765 [candidate division CPR3 bacterium RIFOXYA2_FULL_35_13]OGB76681.1 MAG: hypothetical protein A2476_03570 [candidate division CPR3 bacterium RIFOXYC2_FULL_35_7]OGB78841.1 MAG: hypothetical protein A2296_05275 [candidate division CPR3 bacterium RIFOXYB2_FULL_3